MNVALNLKNLKRFKIILCGLDLPLHQDENIGMFSWKCSEVGGEEKGEMPARIPNDKIRQEVIIYLTFVAISWGQVGTAWWSLLSTLVLLSANQLLP